MIIKALYEQYLRELNDPNSDITPPYKTHIKIGHEWILDDDGELVGIVSLMQEISPKKGKGKSKYIPIGMNVPEVVRKTNGIEPNFLSGNLEYIHGIARKTDKPERIKKSHEAFKDFNREVLSGIDDGGARAMLRFLKKVDPQAPCAIFKERLEEMKQSDGLIVFRLKGDSVRLHERPAIDAAWRAYKDGHTSDCIGQCSITGKIGPLAKIHPGLKGLPDGQTSGASLVSFNKPAFCYGGKSQGENAPISEDVVFAYTTLLNHYLGGNTNQVSFGDIVLVFWAETAKKQEEKMMRELMAGSRFSDEETSENQMADGEDETDRADEHTKKLVRDALRSFRNGEPIFSNIDDVDPKATFYVLGLSAAKGRSAIRFFHKNQFGIIMENIMVHYKDMEMLRQPREPASFPVWIIAAEAAKKGDIGLLPKGTKEALFQSVLFNTPYPQVLYTETMRRVLAENVTDKNGNTKERINYRRAAFIKAYLTRAARGRNPEREVIPVSLNTETKNIGYRLGRLFAILEYAQRCANEGIVTTIRDRFFTAASTVPQVVFPQLIRLSFKHLRKLKVGRRVWVDKLIQEITSELGDLPAHLSPEDQGQFVLGYYHQKNYRAPNNTSESKEENNDEQ